MIDWLYGELDESQEAPFDDHLASCARCRAELESLRETREAMRELPEVDPPPALSAILLHEAAKRAPAPARARAAIAVESEGRAGVLDWLLGLFRPVLQHPAATAVATLVLVAGVAGSLYLRGGHEVAQPMAMTEDEAAAESAPPPAATPAMGAAPTEAPALAGRGKLTDNRADQTRGYEVQLADEGDSDYSIRTETAQEKSLDDGLVSKTDVGFRAANEPAKPAEEQQKAEERTARMREQKSATSPGAGGGGSVAGAPLDFTANAVSGADPLVDLEEDSDFAQPPPPRANEDKQVVRQTSTVEVTGGTLGSQFDPGDDLPSAGKPLPAKPGAKNKKKAPAPTRGIAKDAPSQPARDRAPEAVAPNAAPPPAEPAGSTSYRVYRDPKQELEWAKTENRKLSQALSTQRCRDAAKIANDILDRNPDYFYDKVAGTKSIKRCQWYVDNEQDRRARTRTKARAQQRRPSPAKAGEQAAQPADAAE